MKNNKVCVIFSMLFIVVSAFLSSCGDEDEPDNTGGSAGGSTGTSKYGLTVNGEAWPIAGSAPNYGSWSFCYWGSPKGSDKVFLMLWDVDLNDVEEGDDVTCDMAFPTEDLAYSCTGGEIAVKKISGSRITLEFCNVKYSYAGPYVGYALADRDFTYQPNRLTINGTVELIRN